MAKWGIALAYLGLTLTEAKEKFGFYNNVDIKRFIVELYEEETAPLKI